MPYTDIQTVHNPAFGTSPPPEWGDGVRDQLSWLAGDSASGNAKPMCRAYRSTFQTVANATFAALQLNLERYDVGGMHSTVSNTSRLTVPSGGAGVYHLSANVSFASNATGIRSVSLRLNGTTTIAAVDGPPVSGGATNMHVSCDWRLAVGDYVECVVYQSSGGNLDVNSVGSYSPDVSARWVGVG